MAHTTSDVETLNSFLRTEVSAVETYRRALNAVRDELVRRTLEECQRDHEARVGSLRQRISKLGGQPADRGAEPWEGAGESERSTIEALEEGEERELHALEREIPHVHGEARRFMRMELLPRQKRTFERVSKLKRTLH